MPCGRMLEKSKWRKVLFRLQNPGLRPTRGLPHLTLSHRLAEAWAEGVPTREGDRRGEGHPRMMERTPRGGVRELPH